MKTILKRTLAIALAFAVTFTFIPALSGGIDVQAATKPAKVTKISLKVSGQSVTVSWRKLKKNLSGYTVYRDGKAVKNVAKNVTTYSDEGLETGIEYSYYVRAYKNTKQKQWFNKKTGKWQKKKPAKKYRGKSKKVTVKLYGKASSTLKCTTSGPNTSSWKITKGGIDYDEATDSISFAWTTNPVATEIRIYRNEVLLTTLSGDATSYVDRNITWTTVEEDKEAIDYKYTVEAYFEFTGGSKTLTAGFNYLKTRPKTTTTD